MKGLHVLCIALLYAVTCFGELCDPADGGSNCTDHVMCHGDWNMICYTSINTNGLCLCNSTTTYVWYHNACRVTSECGTRMSTVCPNNFDWFCVDGYCYCKHQ